MPNPARTDSPKKAEEKLEKRLRIFDNGVSRLENATGMSVTGISFKWKGHEYMVILGLFDEELHHVAFSYGDSLLKAMERLVGSAENGTLKVRADEWKNLKLQKGE